MFSKLKQLLGMGPKTDYAALMNRGAVILDVRTVGEFQTGNVKGSINIPVKELPVQLSRLDKSKPIITVCASGIRSANAKGILQSNGFAEVYNGGSWYNLKEFAAS